MKSIKQVADATNFSAINVGPLSELNEYVLELGPIKIPGRCSAAQHFGPQAAISRFKCFNRAQKQASYTPTRHTKSCIFLKGKW